MRRAQWTVGSAGARVAVLIAAAAALALAARPATLHAAPAKRLPDPDQEGSHEAYQRALDAARSAKYREALAVYDRWLEKHPDGFRAGIERCRLIESVASADEEYGPQASDPELKLEPDCSLALLERFPDTPAVQLFRMENLWGAEAAAFGEAALRKPEIALTPLERATLLRRIARAYVHLKQDKRAADYAMQAHQASDQVDVSVILATRLKDTGLPRQAVAELMRFAGNAEDGYQKVALLIELEAYGEALRMIDGLAAAGVEIGPALRAKALEGAGLTDQARGKYLELRGQDWNRQLALQRLFYIDLAKRDRKAAIAAYEALRDEGRDADPVLRHRLALASAFPGAPWHARDALGLLALLALCGLVALLPGCLIVPVHYIGLLRRAAGPAPAGESRWSLKQLWLISALVLLVQLLGTYLFAYPFLHAMLLEQPSPSVSQLEAARCGAFTVIGSCIAVMAWTRRGDLPSLWRSSWNWRRIAGHALAGTAAIYVLQWLTRRGIDLFRPLADATATTAAGFTTREMLQAVLEAYGPAVLVPLMVVLVPIYEELLCRGVFLHAVARHLPFGWANALQAAAFAAMHDQPEHYPSLFAMGLLAGAWTRRAGGLTPAIAMHGVVNGIAAIALCLVASINHAPGRIQANSQRLAAIKAARLEHLTADCQRQVADACVALGDRQQRGAGTAKDHAQAARSYQQGCDAHSAEACYLLGMLYGIRTSPVHDLTKAVQTHAKACDQGHAGACYQLGYAYYNGSGVEVDRPSAERFYQKACDGGDTDACAIIRQLKAP